MLFFMSSIAHEPPSACDTLLTQPLKFKSRWFLLRTTLLWRDVYCVLRLKYQFWIFLCDLWEHATEIWQRTGCCLSKTERWCVTGERTLTKQGKKAKYDRSRQGKARTAARMSARRKKESRGPTSTSTTSAAVIPYKSRSSEQKAIFKATRTSYQLLQTSVTSMLLKAYTTATYSTIHRNLMYE